MVNYKGITGRKIKRINPDFKYILNKSYGEKYQMVLKGVNGGGWLSQAKSFNKGHLDSFITEKDIIKIKDWGMNAIRVPFDYNCILTDTENYTFNERGI
jgi:endoglucanase